MAIGLGYGNFLSQTTMTYADSDVQQKTLDEIKNRNSVAEGLLASILEYH